jgi:branched-chain amino acid transport system permease protein
MTLTGALGWAFERVIVRPVYGQHLKQILVTMGGMIVAEQLIVVLWGPQRIPVPTPGAFRGPLVLGDVAVSKFRLIVVVVGLVTFAVMHLVLNRTKVGLLIRAGVENREMVESLGYRVRHLFIGVFAVGSALAAVGGVLWGIYEGTLTSSMGSEVLVMVLIVVMIGGLGSVGGCFIASLLVALVANYVGFLAPHLAPVADILLLVVILLWRPRGLYPVAAR